MEYSKKGGLSAAQRDVGKTSCADYKIWALGMGVFLWPVIAPAFAIWRDQVVGVARERPRTQCDPITRYQVCDPQSRPRSLFGVIRSLEWLENGPERSAIL